MSALRSEAGWKSGRSLAAHCRAGVIVLLMIAGCATRAPQQEQPAPTLKVATWNIEHLAEANGLGCQPREEHDYADLRRYAQQLDADVVAFEEVENRAAAARVFPPDQYDILMSTRPQSERSGYCDRERNEGPTLRTQDVGFAIRKGVAYQRNPDLSKLGLGNPDLRWGVDITLTGPQPLRLLAVHLKSGCSAGAENPSCEVLFEQIPVLQEWIAARRREGVAFLILGDWNRRIALADDAMWKQISQGLPADAPLVDAAGGRSATCIARYPDYIDHIVFDPRAATRVVAGSFREFSYGVDEDAYPSDHCPVSIEIAHP
jgi:endonuclease/exonuclease/phosphatase family metal-dependent hydrolase